MAFISCLWNFGGILDLFFVELFLEMGGLFDVFLALWCLSYSCVRVLLSLQAIGLRELYVVTYLD